MLKIWLGDFKDDCIKAPSQYFDLHKKKDWFNKDEVKSIMKLYLRI